MSQKQPFNSLEIMEIDLRYQRPLHSIQTSPNARYWAYTEPEKSANTPRGDPVCTMHGTRLAADKVRC